MITILIIQSKEDDNSLQNLLQEIGYQVEKVFELGDVLKGINSKRFDLVICGNSQGNQDGFYIYKSIRNFLEDLFIPFFMILDRHGLKEELMVANELGVDNVIFKPFNNDIIKVKIENTLRKKTNVNFFKVRDFTNFFKSSLTPMIRVNDEKIQAINFAADKILNNLSDSIIDKKVEHVFKLKEDDFTRLTYFKFKHQVVNECYLTSIKSSIDIPHILNLFFFRGSFSGLSDYLLELNVEPTATPSLGKNIIDQNIVPSTELRLTRREKEIYRLSSNGLPLKIIAEKLDISKRTVERHRANIMQKTNSNNIIEAIAKINNYEFQNS